MSQAESLTAETERTDISAKPNRGIKPRSVASRLSGYGMPLLYGLVVLAIYDGWRNRHDQLISPELGIGYTLGIVGASMMLAMLLYSLRKRLRPLRRLGKIKFWFRLHMVFGVLAPTIILYHSNFHLGSLNSRIALYCMLIVAGSGLIGRYFYARIHYGLYGARATFEDLQRELQSLHTDLAHSNVSPLLAKALGAFEQAVMSPPRSFLASVWRHVSIGVRTRLTYLQIVFRLRKQVDNAGDTPDSGESGDIHWRVRNLVREHLACVRRASELGFYERLFSWWHILHVPLFLMLLLSGIAHVVAVHMY